MNFPSRQKRLISGIICGPVMMVISYLMDGYGMLKEERALAMRPLWVYNLCMVLGMIGVPAMCLVLSAWYEIILDVKAKKWVRNLMIVGWISYAVSSLFLIAVDCLPPVIYQNAVALGIPSEDALTLVGMIQIPYRVPVIFFFLIEDIGISVVLWQLILSNTISVPKWMLVCCPLVMLMLDFVLKAIPSSIMKNISVTLESFGWMLLMIAGMVHLRNTEKS